MILSDFKRLKALPLATKLLKIIKDEKEAITDILIPIAFPFIVITCAVFLEALILKIGGL